MLADIPEDIQQLARAAGRHTAEKYPRVREGQLRLIARAAAQDAYASLCRDAPQNRHLLPEVALVTAIIEDAAVERWRQMNNQGA